MLNNNETIFLFHLVATNNSSGSCDAYSQHVDIERHVGYIHSILCNQMV